jgi:hypothetical protein
VECAGGDEHDAGAHPNDAHAERLGSARPPDSFPSVVRSVCASASACVSCASGSSVISTGAVIGIAWLSRQRMNFQKARLRPTSGPSAAVASALRITG